MAVAVSTKPAFRAAPPRRLFRAPSTLPLSQFLPQRIFGSVSRDGQRFAFAVPIPPARTEVTLASEILAKYPGTYAWADGDTLTVTLEGHQLVLEDERGVRRRLFAESPTSFFFKTTNGDIEFLRNDSGIVTHLMWYSWESGAAAVGKATRR